MELHDRRKEVRDALGMTVIPGEGATHARRRPLTLRELASRLSTDAPYTTLIVHELVQRGLAARLTHPEDRRSKIVTATQAESQATELAERLLASRPLRCSGSTSTTWPPSIGSSPKC